MKQFIKRVLFFFAFFLLILITKKQITPYYLGDKVFNAKYEDYSRDEEQFNSVIFGSSRLYRHVNTLLLDSLLSDYNFSTYNFANWGTYNPESYFLYDNFLNSIDSGKIKIAFLELQQLHPYSNDNCRTTKASYWNTLKYLFFSIEYINHSNYIYEKKQELYKNYLKSYFFGLHDFLFLENILPSKKIKEIGENGFYPLEKAMNEHGVNNKYKKRWDEFHSDTLELENRIKAAKIDAETISPKALNKHHLKFLNSLITKSEQKGIHLIFVLSPRLKKDQYSELIPLSYALPQENIIQLYSYSRYNKFYLSDYSFDVGHLNTKGANLFTEHLALNVKEIKARRHNTLY